MRFAANQAATARFSVAGDVHDPIAERLTSVGAAPVLDLGGGHESRQRRGVVETTVHSHRGLAP